MKKVEQFITEIKEFKENDPEGIFEKSIPASWTQEDIDELNKRYREEFGIDKDIVQTSVVHTPSPAK